MVILDEVKRRLGELVPEADDLGEALAIEPSQKRLGALLQERFVRHRRGGRIWYLDLACIM